MSTTLTPANDCSHSPDPQMADTKPCDKVVTLIGRAIYYVLGVSSLIGLAYSIGVLWPSKREDGSLVEIPISRYLAVVLTSFYVIGLARTLFFFDRPPPTQKNGRLVEWFYPLCVFIIVFVFAYIYRSIAGLVFSVSVITCAIAIVQLTHPVEEFNVAKSLWVISMSLTIGGFTRTDSVGVPILLALFTMTIGIYCIVLVGDVIASKQ